MSLTTLPYQDDWIEQCLELFDLNCPTFFAPNERTDYQHYLAEQGNQYKLVILEEKLVACFGVNLEPAQKIADLNWIMSNPKCHGQGVGKFMMNETIELGTTHGIARVRIAASHLSAPFFAHFGAEEIEKTPNGWGPGMHRIDMILRLD